MNLVTFLSHCNFLHYDCLDKQHKMIAWTSNTKPTSQHVNKSVLVSCTPKLEFPAMPTYTSKSRQHICINENNGTWKHKPHAGIEMHKQDTVGKGLLIGSLIG